MNKNQSLTPFPRSPTLDCEGKPIQIGCDAVVRKGHGLYHGTVIYFTPEGVTINCQYTQSVINSYEIYIISYPESK